jgi:hypothetical protein
MVPVLTLAYSLADQNFQTTKSVGIFNLSVRLLEQLARDERISELTAFTNSTLKDRLLLPPKVRLENHEQAIGGRLGRMVWDQFGVYRAAARAGREWLLLPKGFASFSRQCPVKLALYVHDAILETYYATCPGMPRLELAYFKLCVTANLKQARVIFTNTDFTADEIRRAAARRGLSTPPLVTAGIGFDPTPLTKTNKEERVLVLASTHPHKKTALAVEYFKRWQAQTGFTGLVEWVGALPPGLSLPDFPGWRHRTRLPETQFRKLLQSSRVLVFFSDYEGFGMPPVEAVLDGVCPVYSSLPATREVMADTGCGFDNDSYESFAAALQKAFTMSEAQIDAWRQELSRRFDWSKVGERIVRALSSF